MSDDHLSPQAAANLVGLGRTTIMRALEKSEIPLAFKDNNGRWKIVRSGFDDWFSQRPVHARKKVDISADTNGSQPEITLDSEAGRRVVSAEIRAEVAEAKVEILEKMIERLTAPKSGFWKRIFGSGS